MSNLKEELVRSNEKLSASKQENDELGISLSTSSQFFSQQSCS
jgi:hypothetical protein